MLYGIYQNKIAEDGDSEVFTLILDDPTPQIADVLGRLNRRYYKKGTKVAQTPRKYWDSAEAFASQKKYVLNSFRLEFIYE
jgi:hypothetical protein